MLGRIDRVVLAIVALFLALAAYDRGQAWRTLLYTGVELAGIGPWLAASVLLAAAAKATGADTLIARAFTGRQGRMIVAAALMGALLPFCSCGVVPLVAGLLAAGVPLAPVMAYWIASPLMDPTQFLVTAGGLGIGFALAKTAGAIGMGVASGYTTMALTRVGWLSQGSALRIAPVASSCCIGKRLTPAPDRPIWRFWTEPERAQIFLVEASATGWFLVRWLAIAFVLESILLASVPAEEVAHWLGTGSGALAVPLAVAIGVMTYINSLAAVPLVSGLIGLGMSPGTGLAFMLAGGATSVPALLAVWPLVKPRAFALHLAYAIIGALLAGYVYAAILVASA
jgi:uncharacterized membrane protein YraQ (UPF0718 family)